MTNNATNKLLMVRPVAFAMNEQTAVDNYYQKKESGKMNAQESARDEFDGLVEKLRAEGVQVEVLEDTHVPHTPDSIFPNNWISMHQDGRVALYPMKAENRRLERRTDIFEELQSRGYEVTTTVDYTAAEQKELFLEGTGSMVLDHDSKIAYMARSQRADEGLFHTFCKDFNYEPVVFTAYQETPDGIGQIYHTNVMMCVTDAYVLVCLDTIHDANERALVEEAILKSGKEILVISVEQKCNFAGNMLLVKGAADELILVMSSSAYKALNEDQKDFITQHHRILHSDLHTIETLGGGSARCMLAEIYLTKTA
ncbi:arginine deiminase-related protein [Schleiferiaceae bacterium]|nr:arginine deiminase-related protein [Schleiferiaceae bacterium]